MFTRVALGLSLLVSFGMPNRATAADKVTMQTLSARLAEKPTGEAAKALADDVRAWFGKDRSGKNNVPPAPTRRSKALHAAWAIEAPQARAVDLKLGDETTLPLTRIGDTPVFAGVFMFKEGAAFRWAYETDGKHVGPRRRISSFTLMPPSSPRCPACPKASCCRKNCGKARSIPAPRGRGGSTCPLSTRKTSPPA